MSSVDDLNGKGNLAFPVKTVINFDPRAFVKSAFLFINIRKRNTWSSKVFVEFCAGGGIEPVLCLIVFVPLVHLLR